MAKVKAKAPKKKAAKKKATKQKVVKKAAKKRASRKKLVEPGDAVKKLTEIDRLRFVELDTALHNINLEIRGLKQEQQLAQIDFEQRKQGRHNRIAQLRVALSTRMQEQQLLLVKMGSEYNFDPKRTSIDDASGVIQEHPPNR